MDSVKLSTLGVSKPQGPFLCTGRPEIQVQTPSRRCGHFAEATPSTSWQNATCRMQRISSTRSSTFLWNCKASRRPVSRRQAQCVMVRASQGVDQTAGSASTDAIGGSVQDLKRTVMSAISNTNRGKNTTFDQRRSILKLIEELEQLNSTEDPVDSPLFSGRWALLYTAPVDEKTADKYAGTEEGPFLARVKPAAFGSVRQLRSTQVLDTLGGTAQNIADFTFFGLNGSLNIRGTVVKSPPQSNGAVKVDVTFTNFVLKVGTWTSPAISLSWVNPKGWIYTTFLDEDMRVGRGDKGSIFVAVRIKQA